MHTFVDNANRTWTVAINVATIKRVQGRLNINLCQLIDDGLKPLAKLVSDPIQLVDVLYCLCQDEAQARNVSDEDFGRAMAGDVLEMAELAFLDELVAFFRNAHLRNLLAKVLAEGRQVGTILLQKAEEHLATFDANRLANKLLNSSGTAPASSASIPDLSPCANSA